MWFQSETRIFRPALEGMEPSEKIVVPIFVDLSKVIYYHPGYAPDSDELNQTVIGTPGCELQIRTNINDFKRAMLFYKLGITMIYN